MDRKLAQIIYFFSIHNTDNLNIEDVFDQHRLENLKNLFRKQFWPRSQNDLHMTSIASSLELGYR